MRMSCFAIVGLTSLAVAPVTAQRPLAMECRDLGVSPAIVDSVEARLGKIDSLRAPTEGMRTEHCARVAYRPGSRVILALQGDDERSGGLAVLTAKPDSVESVQFYPAARDLVPLGNRRLLFTYTQVRELLGAGIYESRYVVLCAITSDEWLPCLDVPKDQITRIMGGPTLPSLEQHGRLVVVGSRLRYQVEYRFDGDGPDSGKRQRMRPVFFDLPMLR